MSDELWAAYRKLKVGQVRGAAANHILTDLVSLVRFAMHQENELVPFPDKVQVNFRAWVEQQQASGKKFTAEQRKWLERIRDYIAGNLEIDNEGLELIEAGGLGKCWNLFGDDLSKILDELNEALAA